MSKQSNLGSAPPSPIDIDTPDGSIFGADLRDNETQYTHQWNEHAGLFTNLQGILEHLKSGYDLLKKQNSLCLAASLDYGEWLNMAFELYSLEKLAEKITVTWKEWLEATVGIQDSYARKLREVAKLLCKYPRFKSLGLSFSEIYQRRKQIQVMLATDSSVAKYWHQAN